jgi:hypothetical protein
MNRNQLEHAIRAACEVSGDNELFVFGSQAILAEFPNPPSTLCSSIEVDVQPKNKSKGADLIDGVLGELSLFHQTHGFYVHGISIKSAKLPLNWQKRLIKVSDPNTTLNKTGWCVEKHDLAASKLAAFRPKDKAFVLTLLLENMIKPTTLSKRLSNLNISTPHYLKIKAWLKATMENLS